MTQPSPPIEHFLILGPKNFPSGNLCSPSPP